MNQVIESITIMLPTLNILSAVIKSAKFDVANMSQMTKSPKFHVAKLKRSTVCTWVGGMKEECKSYFSAYKHPFGICCCNKCQFLCFGSPDNVHLAFDGVVLNPVDSRVA